MQEEADFFMLSDVLTEDRELRVLLQRQRLEDVLHWQEQERKDETSEWNCLFCRSSFTGWHGHLLDHMLEAHNFSLGQPNNLVFVKELLVLLKKKLEAFVCLFCDKVWLLLDPFALLVDSLISPSYTQVYKSREVLKEHMRKKGHRMIKSGDSSYDRFYVVNYQEFGKNWGALAKEAQFDDDDDELNGFNARRGSEEGDWEEWRGDPDKVTCLFCPATYPEMEDLLIHMTSIHDFDYQVSLHSKLMSFKQLEHRRLFPGRSKLKAPRLLPSGEAHQLHPQENAL